MPLGFDCGRERYENAAGNRELYNVENDPHQDHDLAQKHPETVAKMRTHLERWWNEVKDDVMTPQRVVIGSDNENPMLLTACEWLDVFVDQQQQVRRADRKNGTWHLQVAESGMYQIEVRRWPRESELKLDQGIPETRVTDGVFVAGQALSIASATVRCNGKQTGLVLDPSAQMFSTTVALVRGPLQLTATFRNEKGEEICGAYYAHVQRLVGQ